MFVDRLGGILVEYQHTDSDSDPSTIRFQTGTTPLQIHKHYTLTDNQLHVCYRFSNKADNRFSTEINLAMPSCDGMGGRFINKNKIPGGFGQLLELTNLSEITLDDDTLGGSVSLRTTAPVRLLAHPHFTVSQSESGFEKIMQAVTLLLEWPIRSKEFTITLDVHKK